MAPGVASIQEPFGNAVYTVLSAPVTAKTVLVTGCGPIGLWAIGIAKAAGAKAVYATDINPLRLELAEKMGATIAINSSQEDPVEVIKRETGGIGVDVLCEMSGNWRAIKQGFEALRNGGRVSILGIPRVLSSLTSRTTSSLKVPPSTAFRAASSGRPGTRPRRSSRAAW